VKIRQQQTIKWATEGGAKGQPSSIDVSLR
jgi:hypothetical protein